MKKKILFTSLCTFLLITTGCGHEVALKDGEEVVASIDGYAITAEGLFKDLKKQYGTSIVVNMIDDFIVNEEIKDSSEAEEYAKAELEKMKYTYQAYGYTIEDVLAQYGYESEQELIDVYINSYKKETIAKKYLKENRVTDEEINSYYESEIYGNYNAKHILVKPVTNDTMTDEQIAEAEKTAYNKALEVVEKLKNGEEWNKLVSEYSEDTGSVETNGLIENFTKGDMVDEFFNAVVDLKDNEYTTTPVKSTYGYHIVLRVSATEKPALDDVKNKVMDALIENYLEEDKDLFNKTWTDIRKSYNLEINDTTIEKFYKKTIAED